jgi:hypothetical protein
MEGGTWHLRRRDRYRFLVEKSGENSHLEDLGVNGNMLFKQNLKK